MLSKSTKAGTPREQLEFAMRQQVACAYKTSWPELSQGQMRTSRFFIYLFHYKTDFVWWHHSTDRAFIFVLRISKDVLR